MVREQAVGPREQQCWAEVNNGGCGLNFKVARNFKTPLQFEKTAFKWSDC